MLVLNNHFQDEKVKMVLRDNNNDRMIITVHIMSMNALGVVYKKINDAKSENVIFFKPWHRITNLIKEL